MGRVATAIWLFIAAIVLLMLLMIIGKSGGIKLLSDILMTIPAPTKYWAEIVGHLAWPLLTVFLVYRFRRFVSIILKTLVDRLGTDHVKIGPFELTPNSEVLVLDPEEVDAEQAEYVDHIEKLFEFIGDAAGEAKLKQWMNENEAQDLSLVDFLTHEAYADKRSAAVQGLIE